MKLPNCPNCNKPENLINTAQCKGQNQFEYSLDGGLVEVNYESGWYRHNKRVYCAGCGELRRDLYCTKDGYIHLVSH